MLLRLQPARRTQFMPTYNYKCSNCNKVYSIFQNINDRAYTQCDKCGNKINRLITGGSGLIFKGSGFYKTDYVDNKKKEKLDSSKQTNNKKEERVENKIHE